MSLRRFSAILILAVLLITPFINWRLGAVIWMCAWIMYVVQMAFNSRQRRVNPQDEEFGDKQKDDSA